MESSESTGSSEAVSTEAQVSDQSQLEASEASGQITQEERVELERLRKLTKGAYKAFEEASQMRKSIEAERADFESKRRDVKALLSDPELGQRARQAIIEELAEQHDRLQMLENMSPQEQALYEKEQALARREAAIQARDAEHKALEERAAQEAAELKESEEAKKYAVQVEKEYTKAFETTGLPMTPLLLMLTQQNHLSSVSAGVTDASVQDMLEVASEEAEQLVTGHIDGLSDEQLAEKLGRKRIERIGKLYVSGVKPKAAPANQQKVEKSPSTDRHRDIPKTSFRNLIS